MLPSSDAGNESKLANLGGRRQSPDPYCIHLLLSDGSTFVTSGRGRPTMTIQALPFAMGVRLPPRAAEKFESQNGAKPPHHKLLFPLSG